MLRNFIDGCISPILNKHGFRKKNLTWNKVEGMYIQVINIQTSRFSDTKEDSFTINLGVFDPIIWEKCWGKAPPEFVKEEDCFPRARVGLLLNGSLEKSLDHWWSIKNTQEDELCNEVKGVIESKCLPFLDKMVIKDHIVSFYSNCSDRLFPIEKIYFAILKKHVGDVTSSEELLADVFAISKSWADRVAQVRSRLD